MSLAKINHIKHVRKPGHCEKCGKEIKVGDPAIRFAVGFRGYTRTRCDQIACFPKPSERESSLVSSAYAAQEDANVDDAFTLEELEEIRTTVADAIREVASEYEENPMFDSNYDLQERVDVLNAAADIVDEWEPADDQPEEDEDGPWTIGICDYNTFDEAHDAWLQAARESLQSTIDEVELP